MEKYLRLATANQPSSQNSVSCNVTGIEEDSESVYCHYSNASKGQRIIRAKFLVRADGKTEKIPRAKRSPAREKIEVRQIRTCRIIKTYN
jgi:2-polyprenyl-6-methoxyphenol hydroxylase-like FAD-dependent oxidoreductase